MIKYAFLGALVLVSACSSSKNNDGFFHDRANDYQQAQLVPELEIAKDLKTSKLPSRYEIPEAPKEVGEFIKNPVPPGL